MRPSPPPATFATGGLRPGPPAFKRSQVYAWPDVTLRELLGGDARKTEEMVLDSKQAVNFLYSLP